VFVAARTSDVSGTINAGTLTVSSTNTGSGVRLGTAGTLTLGTLATSSTSGNGNLVVNTNGGPAVLSGTGTTNVAGTATITTGGGAVTQGAGAFRIGDSQSNASLTINSGRHVWRQSPHRPFAHIGRDDHHLGQSRRPERLDDHGQLGPPDQRRRKQHRQQR
jgi:hypothetical protein